MVARTGIDETWTTAPSTRAQQRHQDSRRGARRATPQFRTSASSPSSTGQARPGRRRPVKRVALSALVMAFAAALVATVALPSYAVDPARSDQDIISGRTVLKATGEQRYLAEEGSALAALDRDTFTATSSATLRRASYEQQFAAYNGPSAADFLSNPAHPAFSLDAVYNTGLQYLGVPYVFGGADPSGFDCSGFIMFVYAQYGINLPHSVHLQDGIGTPISQADAQPGDVVVFNNDSHDGFYAGNGMILHAPYPGARVRVQKLWTNNVHFIRFGI